MAIHGLMNQQPFVIWDGVFELHYLENRGAAFGILQGKKIFFVIFTLVVLCMIAYLYLKRIPDEKKFRPIDGICILIFQQVCIFAVQNVNHEKFYYSPPLYNKTIRE